jgi:16S rRNA U1498 N3-methylase RsmE
MIAEISKVQMKIEGIHYNHFEQIKQLCQGEQLNLFDQVTNEIATIFSPKRTNDRR